MPAPLSVTLSGTGVPVVTCTNGMPATTCADATTMVSAEAAGGVAGAAGSVPGPAAVTLEAGEDPPPQAVSVMRASAVAHWRAGRRMGFKLAFREPC
ncbi:hypothetical protein RugamoR57_30590 [Duganella caerulea]